VLRQGFAAHGVQQVLLGIHAVHTPAPALDTAAHS
jgi:hypothetical protein